MMSLFGIKDRARWVPESMARLLLYACMTSRRASKLLPSSYFPSAAVVVEIPFKHVHVFRSGRWGVQELMSASSQGSVCSKALTKVSQRRCQRMNAACGGGAGKQCLLKSPSRNFQIEAVPLKAPAASCLLLRTLQMLR